MMTLNGFVGLLLGFFLVAVLIWEVIAVIVARQVNNAHRLMLTNTGRRAAVIFEMGAAVFPQRLDITPEVWRQHHWGTWSIILAYALDEVVGNSYHTSQYTAYDDLIVILEREQIEKKLFWSVIGRTCPRAAEGLLSAYGRWVLRKIANKSNAINEFNEIIKAFNDISIMKDILKEYHQRDQRKKK